MATYVCCACQAGMDPRDGHRECPPCLGRAHVLRDVDDPCDAALDLPHVERARRAAQALQSASPTRGPPPPAQEPSRGHADRHSRKRRGHRSGDGYGGSREHASRSSKRSRTQETGETQQAILAAIQALSARMERFEAAGSSAAGSHRGSSQAPSVRRPDEDDDDGDVQDALSLHASGSITATGTGVSRASVSSGTRSGRCDVEAESAADKDVAETLMSTVLSAAKVLGMSLPPPQSVPSGGVYSGVSQARSPPVFPVAIDYPEMLKKNWATPSSDSFFNRGCRGLARMGYHLESGMGNMPPVEQGIAALTKLGPTGVTPNSKCPNKQCRRTDSLVCRTYNSAARAARSGNALVLILAALEKIVGPGDSDARTLVNAALMAHSQLTRDIGTTMASAMVTRRQVWLAQTGLSQNVQDELREKPVMPGHVFHEGFQESLDRAVQCFQAREKVQQFHRPVSSRLGPRRSSQGSYRSRGDRQASWGRGKYQRDWDQAFQASGSGARQFHRQKGSGSRNDSGSGPRGRRPQKGAGRQGGSA